MAEFCSNCYAKYGFTDYDIDLFKIALSLKKGRSKNVLCEGCNIRAIYKDDVGLIYIGFIRKNEIVLEQVKIEEL